MKNLIFSFGFFAVLCSSAAAGVCLDDLKGEYFYQTKNIEGKLFSVQLEGRDWKFNRPDDPEADSEKLFRYSFDESNTLNAKEIPVDQLPHFGMALLRSYMEKPRDAEGVIFDCGLVSKEFYLMRIDLSKANAQLIKNMIMLTKALNQNKRYESAPTSKEMDQMRKQKYFAGQSLHLEGVTSGVVGFILQK